MINPIILTIGWCIGALSLFLGILAVYYMYKTSRIYGGKIGSSLNKICIGTAVVIIGLIVLGAILTLISQQSPESEVLDMLLIVTVFTVPGFLAMALGARKLASVATEAK